MALVIETLGIPGPVVLRPAKHTDARGFFSETYSKQALAEAGVAIEFVQDNHALSLEAGTVRGLHFQIPPFAQHKLVRVVRGAILDIAVDIRLGSPNYGKYVSAKISADAWNQILVPVGFAHGLTTLEANTEVIYKVSNRYSSEHDKGLFWKDPTLGIDWPVSETEAVLSKKDKQLPKLSELPDYFHYDPGEA